MTQHTSSLILKIPAQDAFAFLSAPENLPKWAIHFCSSIRAAGDQHVIETSRGEMNFRMESNADTGVIDMFSGPTANEMMPVYTRVVQLCSETTAYIFTIFQPPGVNEAEFTAMCKPLDEELDTLRTLLEPQ